MNWKTKGNINQFVLLIPLRMNTHFWVQTSGHQPTSKTTGSHSRVLRATKLILWYLHSMKTEKSQSNRVIDEQSLDSQHSWPNWNCFNVFKLAWRCWSLKEWRPWHYKMDEALHIIWIGGANFYESAVPEYKLLHRKDAAWFAISCESGVNGANKYKKTWPGT